MPIQEVRHIDVSNRPELLRLAEEVQKSGEKTVLSLDGEELVEVRPIKPARKKRAKGRTTSEDDLLGKLIGIFDSGGAGDVSANKYKYLADAYLDDHKNS